MGKLYQPGKKQITKTIRDAFFGLLLLVLYLSSYFLLWQSTTYLLHVLCTYTTHAFYLIFFGLLLFIISLTSTTSSSSYTFPIPILGMLRIMHLNIYVCVYRGKCIYKVLAALAILKNLVLQYNIG